MSSTGTSSSSLPNRNGMPKGRDVISSSHREEREKKMKAEEKNIKKKKKKNLQRYPKALN